MNRVEFIKELEYLLQDIPDEEKEEAIAYYRDYLEDAGDDKEDSVIREFGSPERIAAIIRADLNGSLEEGGGFTETGYQDERFKDPGYQVTPRKELPQTREETQESQRSKNQNRNDSTLWRAIKVLLLIGVLFLLSPVVLGLGGGAFGIFVAVCSVVLVLVLAVAIVTIVLWVVAFGMVIAGIGTMIAQPWTGVLLLGLGILLGGLALLALAISALVYGKLIPMGIRGIVGLISRIFHRGRGGVA